MASQILLNRSAFEAKKETLQGAVNTLKTNASTLDGLRNNTVNATVNNLVVRKANIRFVGMNVYVHYFRRHVNMQGVKRILPLH